MRKLLFPLLLVAAGCGESEKDDELRQRLGNQQSGVDIVDPGTMPVRIGEFGRNFNACALVGTPRGVDNGAPEPLQVRAAPADNAAEAGTIAADAQFFICSRSLDQRWLGVVYDESGTLAPACGVSRPVASRRKYEGPCRSGWVSAASVKQIGG